MKSVVFKVVHLVLFYFEKKLREYTYNQTNYSLKTDQKSEKQKKNSYTSVS